MVDQSATMCTRPTLFVCKHCVSTVGVYLDVDVLVIRPLHAPLAYTTVLVEEPIGAGLINYALTLLVDGHGSVTSACVV